MNKAAYLDCDGVIRHNDRSKQGGNFYTLSYDDVEWIDGAIEAHRRLYDMGYKVFWVTMQNCINERKISYEDCKDIFIQMQEYVNGQCNAPVVKNFVICTSKENSEAKIMAKSKAVKVFSEQYTINLEESFGCGDARADVIAFKEAGVGTVVHIDLPDTTAKNDHNVLEADGIAPSLSHAIHWFDWGGNDPKSLFSDIVNKVTGREYIILNDNSLGMCYKIIQIFKGRISSVHRHEIKNEVFTVLEGRVRFVVDQNKYVCAPGHTITIPCGVYHSFEALSPVAIFLEVSGYHQDSDTYRLTQSGVGDAL